MDHCLFINQATIIVVDDVIGNSLVVKTLSKHLKIHGILSFMLSISGLPVTLSF